MVFENGQSNSVIQIYPGLFLVAMATKFGTKWAITRLLLETYAIFAFIGRFSRMGYRMLPMKFCATFHGCHANEIWDKKGYNLASARDICEILAFIRRGGRFRRWAIEYCQQNFTATDSRCHGNEI